MDSPNFPAEDNSRRVGDYIGSINQQGRVTIPNEVRRALQLNSQDKVVFRITANTVELPGKLPTLEDLAGSVSALEPARDLNDVIREVKAERAEQLTQKLQM